MVMTPAHYDAIAGWYDEQVRGGLLHELTLPALLELAGEVAGQSVCDLACGQGVAARALAGRGARVMGIDLSGVLLEIARGYEAEGSLGIEYRWDDAQRLDSVADRTFDGVVCHLGLTDIPDLDACARTVARVLRPGGWFAFAVAHPCLEVLRGQDRLVAGADGAVATTRSYFAEGPWRSDNPDGVRGRVPVQHRTLATLLNAFAGAGLVLERLAEPRPEGALAASLARFREQPGALLVRFRRP